MGKGFSRLSFVGFLGKLKKKNHFCFQKSYEMLPETSWYLGILIGVLISNSVDDCICFFFF